MKTLKEFKYLLEEFENISYGEGLFSYCREVSSRSHFIHLITDSYSIHMALDSYYKDIIDLADKFSETFIGKYSKFKNYSDIDLETNNPIELLENFNSWIKEYRDKISNDSEIQNIIDEICELNNSTLYKLKNLK